MEKILAKIKYLYIKYINKYFKYLYIWDPQDFTLSCQNINRLQQFNNYAILTIVTGAPLHLSCILFLPWRSLFISKLWSKQSTLQTQHSSGYFYCKFDNKAFTIFPLKTIQSISVLYWSIFWHHYLFLSSPIDMFFIFFMVTLEH